MKNFAALLFSCLLGLTVFGQSPITLTQADMPEPGDTLRYSNAMMGLFDFSQTGANHVWDFTNLVPVSQGREDYEYAVATIYAFYFLAPNNYGTKIGDTLGGGPFTFTNVYNFFKSTSGQFTAEGVGFRYQGVPLAAYYSDEDELFQFPMNYLDRDSSTYEFSVNLGGNISFSQKGYRINEVDGWGTIITPFGSFDCLRLVSTTIGIDSVNYNGFGLSFPNHTTYYKYMTNGMKFPVLEATEREQQGQTQLVRLRYRDQYRLLVGTEEAMQPALEIAPNPALDRLVMQWPYAESGKMSLWSMDGRLVKEMVAIMGQNELTLEGVEAGMYLLRVEDAAGQPIHAGRVMVAR